MSRIVAITEVPCDSPRAHLINVVKTAGGFERLGHHVTLLCRPPESGAAPDFGSAFGEPRLNVVTAPDVVNRAAGRTPEARAAAFAAWAADTAACSRADAVYARSFESALAAAARGLPVAMETHASIGDPNPALQRSLEATARRDHPIGALITISPRLAAHYAVRGADPRRIRVVPDGVDIEMFTPMGNEPWLRTGSAPGSDAGMRQPSTAGCGTVLYSGHLYDYKGVPTLVAAAALLQNATVHLVGGLPDDVLRARRLVADLAPGRVLVHGPVPHAAVPRWLWCADALVLPPSAREPSANWTSPVKLGEYLAAGAPIVASDIPALRDWVDDRAVVWFRADDPADLARAIREALAESPARAAARRAHAAGLAARFSYPARARAILSALGRASAGPVRPGRAAAA